MDRIYDGVLRQFAERLEIRPDEVNVDPKTHPSFYRALMHAAWLDGALALGVEGPVGRCATRWMGMQCERDAGHEGGHSHHPNNPGAGVKACDPMQHAMTVAERRELWEPGVGSVTMTAQELFDYGAECAHGVGGTDGETK